MSFLPKSGLGDKPPDLASVSEEEVIEHLVPKRRWLDGLMVTGGGPTLHEDLSDFARKIRELEFVMGVETNGTNPRMVEDLTRNGLVDYIAVDIKAPLTWDKYKVAVGVDDKELFEKVKGTAKILLHSDADYEFRTIIVPNLTNEKDTLQIAKQLKNARKYCLQQFVPKGTLDEEYEDKESYPVEELVKIKNQVEDYFEICELRNVQ